MRISDLRIGVTVILVLAITQLSMADTIFLDFFGNAGPGLLPGNENPPVVSGAFGDETGTGLVYDDATNILSMLFDFQGLSDGLDTSIGSGIHLHLSDNPADPFGSNGGVAFNLNSGADPNVVYNSPLIANGAEFGTVDVDLTFTDAQEADLLAGRYYVNIHSQTFGGGELRGNVVPEPNGFGVMALAGVVLLRRRRR